MPKRSDTSISAGPGGVEESERPGARVGRRLPSGRHNLPRAFVVRDQRERILDAMGRVVAEKGYVAATVADVTNAAGVSRTTFYELFTDKEDCFLATYDAAEKILFDRVARAALAAGDEWEARLRAGLREFLTTLEAEPALSHTCIVEAPAAGAAALEKVRVAMRGFQELLRDRRPAAADEPPRLAAQFFIGGLYDTVYNRLFRGETLVELEDDLFDIAIYLLRPRG